MRRGNEIERICKEVEVGNGEFVNGNGNGILLCMGDFSSICYGGHGDAYQSFLWPTCMEITTLSTFFFIFLVVPLPPPQTTSPQPSLLTWLF